MGIGLLGLPKFKFTNEKCQKFIQSLPQTKGTGFSEGFADVSMEVQDLLTQMVQWDPDSRTTARQAIRHTYLNQLHCPEDEPTREPLDMSEFEFERRKVTANALREEIFHETLSYYPAMLEQYEQELTDPTSP